MAFESSGRNPLDVYRKRFENNPDNLDRALSYINRDQYGAIQSFNPASAIQSSSGGHWRRWTNDKNNPSFSEQMNFVWNYQIKEMYLRYFAWQFIGRSDKQSDKAWLINDLNGDHVGNRNIDVIYFFISLIKILRCRRRG